MTGPPGDAADAGSARPIGSGVTGTRTFSAYRARKQRPGERKGPGSGPEGDGRGARYEGGAGAESVLPPRRKPDVSGWKAGSQ
ncbi:hypothetical protein TPA0909_34060 [Streptomyces albus]|nr:hypothetical protein TPA0909_34060 [Streptomyces albus]